MNATEATRLWAEQRSIALHCTAQTGSTNDDAKAMAMREADDFVLHLTDHQTAGRGRGPNHWLDTGAGECLLSTWSLHVDSPPQAITAPRIGLALFQAARHTWPSLSWALKAPNDLYLSGLKSAGLLVETVSSGANHRLLIGLGLNATNHPRSFAGATNLTAALGRAPEDNEWFRFLDDWKAQLLAAVPDCLKPALSANACGELKAALNANPKRAFAVDQVSPQGDIIHPGGRVKWTDL